MTGYPRVIALYLTSAVVALLCLPGPAEAATPTCFGHRPTITGTSGDDVIRGTPRADVIVGRAGGDRIYGRGGADLICGGNVDGDLLFGGAGADRIDGGSGRESIYGGGGDDVIHARCGDCGHGDGLLQHLYGGAGHDRIFGSKDPELVHGGDGRDTIVGRGSINGVVGVEDELYGDAGDDAIVAGSKVVRSDDMAGSWADGGEGNDELRDIDGVTTFPTGPGDDTYIGADVCCTKVSFALSPAAVHVDLVNDIATGDGHDVVQNILHLDATDHADTIVGDELPNRFFGGGGSDVISGGTGVDILDGGDGVDTLEFPTEVSVEVDLASRFSRSRETGEQDSVVAFENVIGTPGADLIRGYAALNVLQGGAGADEIFGEGGADRMFGDDGDDRLDGGDDALPDTADGGDGFDLCTRAEEVVNCEA